METTKELKTHMRGRGPQDPELTSQAGLVFFKNRPDEANNSNLLHVLDRQNH
jgi:hypothetical protein